MHLEETGRACADAIRRARGDESQQAFATRIGCGIATLQRWESGKTVPTQHQHVEALKGAGVPPEVLEAAAAVRAAA